MLKREWLRPFLTKPEDHNRFDALIASDNRFAAASVQGTGCGAELGLMPLVFLSGANMTLRPAPFSGPLVL
jgi:hypothetical protein